MSRISVGDLMAGTIRFGRARVQRRHDNAKKALGSFNESVEGPAASVRFFEGHFEREVRLMTVLGAKGEA